MPTVAKPSSDNIRWNLSALYDGPSDPAIAGTWKTQMARAQAFAAEYRGKVAGLTSGQLLAALKLLEDISNESVKPIHFANLLFAADTSDPKLGAFCQAQMEESSTLRIELMFFELELQKADATTIANWLKSSELQPYRHHLETVLRYKPHTLDEAQEVLLEETANVGSRAWTRLHDELTSNQVFPYIDPTTSEQKGMSQEEVTTLLRDPNRAVRAAAAAALTKGLTELQRVVPYLYNTLLADKKLEDRLRGFKDPEDSRHLANELDKETVDLVTNLCRERSDLVERFYLVKRELLGLDELTHIDRYAPLAESKKKVTWSEARELVLESFATFSPELSLRAGEFFEGQWIDAESRPGKSGGAFCNYNTPDTHPVVMMTYLDGLDDVMTLAHELGHGAHASLSRDQTPFNFHGTLPLAELASIFGEMLVFEQITSRVDEEDLLPLYAQKIEGIFATVHRQAAMFRFEQRCHLHRRSKGELAPEAFHAIWQEEMQSMFGKSITLGEDHRMWWQYIGHFIFAPFYVYAYSFGELLTLSLYQMAKREGPSFADKYLAVLRLGGSQTPQELMAHLGVDLRSREFWLAGFEAIEGFVSRFEALAAARTR